MEKSLVWDSPKQWQQVFHGIGIPLMVVSTGCCGMAGIYGHEVEHFTQSKGIYEISWGRYLSGIHQERQCVLVTGFSCRSQVKRFEGFVPQHPVQALLKLLK
jgi:Fe-S oxidoreductase